MKIIEISLNEVAAEYFIKFGLDYYRPDFSDYVDRVKKPVRINGETYQHRIM